MFSKLKEQTKQIFNRAYKNETQNTNFQFSCKKFSISKKYLETDKNVHF